jgi:alpha-mannosidase
LATAFTGRHKGVFPGDFSFFQLRATGIILDTLKKQEKGDGFIVRLYESQGRDERAALRFYKAPRQVYETDLLENKVRELKSQGPELGLDFKKYEIKTLLIFY